jgi:hypothetical protein
MLILETRATTEEQPLGLFIQPCVGVHWNTQPRVLSPELVGRRMRVRIVDTRILAGNSQEL